MIPRLSGNLGVDLLLHRRAGLPAPPPDATARAIERMAALGADGVEEYVAWALVEPRRDAWDWGVQRETAARAAARKLRYVAYAWLHVVPDWFAASGDFVPFRCSDHGATCGWPSPFAPATLAAHRRFHAELARALGDRLDALCLAFPADYGEVGLPAGFGAWACPPPPPHDHVHPGWWLGDPHAQAAWERFAAARGAPIELRAALASAATRPLVARFAAEAVAGYVDALLADARARFPALPLWIKLGHGGESAGYGIDASLLARVAARRGAGIRTTQATLPTLHQQRIATACRWFAVPLASEPPLDVGREKAVARIFDDAAGGVVEAFAYPEQLAAARDLDAKWGALRSGRAAECDVAVHFSRAALEQQADLGYPPRLYALADALRDRADFRVVDGRLIEAGALAGCSVVALTDDCDEPEPVQQELLRFVAAGGTLLVAPCARVAAGPLAEVVARAPSADGALELRGAAPPSLQLAMGTAGEERWLVGAWHAPEEACQFQETPPRGVKARWTGACGGVVVPRAAGRRTLLELEAWVHPRAAPQRVRVVADGAVVGELALPGLQRFVAWLPATHDERASTIALDATPFVPAERGLGPDRRTLGVALIWLRVTLEGEVATGEAAVGGSPLEVAVDEAKLAGATRRVGAGAIVRCEAAPLARFVGLFDHVVARASEWGRAAPRGQDGRRAAGVRLARFGGRWLAWNRGAATAKLALPSRPAASREVAPGGLAEIEEGASP